MRQIILFFFSFFFLLSFVQACITADWISDNYVKVGSSQNPSFVLEIKNQCTQPTVATVKVNGVFHSRYILSAGSRKQVNITAEPGLMNPGLNHEVVTIQAGDEIVEKHFFVELSEEKEAYIGVSIPYSIATPSKIVTIPIKIGNRGNVGAHVVIFRKLGDGELKFWKIVQVPSGEQVRLNYEMVLGSECQDVEFNFVYDDRNITRKVSVCLQSSSNLDISIDTRVEKYKGQDALIIYAKVKNLDLEMPHQVFLDVEDAPPEIAVLSSPEELEPGKEAFIKVTVYPIKQDFNSTLAVYVDNALSQEVPISTMESRKRSVTGLITLSEGSLFALFLIVVLFVVAYVKRRELRRFVSKLKRIG